jgi:hypothetical protein
MLTAVVIISILAVMVFSAWLPERAGRSHPIRIVKTLSASCFAERADIYVCDKCGRDLTKRFRPGQSHSWTPMDRQDLFAAAVSGTSLVQLSGTISAWARMWVEIAQAPAWMVLGSTGQVDSRHRDNRIENLSRVAEARNNPPCRACQP